MSGLKNLNIADYFSIYRLVAVPLLIMMIVFHQRILTGTLLLVSFSTDAIDGYIARQKKIETSRGAKLDSVGDLITLLIGLAAFITFETEFFLNHLPLIAVTATLFIAQLLITIIRFKKVSSYHTYLAKLTAIPIAAFLIMVSLIGPIEPLFYIAFYLGIAEAVEEIIITFVLEKPRENVKGLYWILKESGPEN